VLEAVHTAAGRSVRALVPPQSTADAVTEQLARASLVHLSCHGFLRTDNPTFSALQLADGPLTVQELSGTQQLARRIILAACRSGDQATYAGNEVLGFVSALLSRGAAGVVAATVPVPDGESVPLMQGLHERLVAGRTLATALSEARQTMGRSALDFGDCPLEYLAWYAYTAYGAA
jgi:CHAT domain-containing protein